MGEVGEAHGADVLGTLNDDLLFWRASVNAEVACEGEPLECANRLILDGLDVMLVGDADHCRNFAERTTDVVVGSRIAVPDLGKSKPLGLGS